MLAALLSLLVVVAAPLPAQGPATSPTASPSRSEATAAAEAFDAELAATSIVLQEGICGGLCGPSRHRTVVFGYDWNRRAYRIVEERREPYRAAVPPRYFATDLEPRRFRELVERLTSLGLSELPLERPTACEDLYGRDIGLRWMRKGRLWENQAPGGCVYSASRVSATEEQRGRFDAAVAELERAATERELAPTTSADWWAPPRIGAVEAELLTRALAALDDLGWGAKVEANAFSVRIDEPQALRFEFPWRGTPLEAGNGGSPPRRPTGCEVRVEADRPGADRPGASVVRIRRADFRRPEPTARLGKRLGAPSTAAPEVRTRLVEGWITEGMSESMVVAAFGPPSSRRDEAGTVTLEFAREGRAEPWLALRLVDDRLRLRR